MFATRPLLAKGFWGRSMDELKRLTHIAVTFEGIKGASSPYQLFNFHSADSVNDCKTMSDVEIGGSSTSHLEWVPSAPPKPTSSPSPLRSRLAPPPVQGPPGYARFHGVISTDLPKDRPDIKRTGYAAFRTQDRGRTVFGQGVWDIDPYTFLALRVRTDGRAYFVNVQTDSIVETDLHQHRLFTKKPGQWETVLIRWNDFVRTNYGFVVEPQTELLRQKVKSVGIGLTDRIPGPFEVCIERIWATNDASEGSAVVAAPGAEGEETGERKVEVGGGRVEGGLKTKDGKKIQWGDSKQISGTGEVAKKV